MLNILQDEFGVVSNILNNMLDDDNEAVPAEVDQYEYLQRPKVYLNDTILGPDGCSEECRGGCVGGANNCVACRNLKFGTVCVKKVSLNDIKLQFKGGGHLIQ